MMENTENRARQKWMGTLAKAPEAMLSDVWKAAHLAQSFKWLRAPEVGAVMVRGATGGTGAAFNLGEMTVTRCSLQIESGAVGHAYIAGRNRSKAEIAAQCDALMQTDAAADVQRQILDLIEANLLADRKSSAAKAAATKVDFFTLVRGED